MQWNAMYHKCNTAARMQNVELPRLERDAPCFPVKLNPNQIRAMLEAAFRAGYQQHAEEASQLS